MAGGLKWRPGARRALRAGDGIKDPAGPAAPAMDGTRQGRTRGPGNAAPCGGFPLPVSFLAHAPLPVFFALPAALPTWHFQGGGPHLQRYCRSRPRERADAGAYQNMRR